MRLAIELPAAALVKMKGQAIQLARKEKGLPLKNLPKSDRAVKLFETMIEGHKIGNGKTINPKYMASYIKSFNLNSKTATDFDLRNAIFHQEKSNISPLSDMETIIFRYLPTLEPNKNANKNILLEKAPKFANRLAKSIYPGEYLTLSRLAISQGHGFKLGERESIKHAGQQYGLQEGFLKKYTYERNGKTVTSYRTTGLWKKVLEELMNIRGLKSDATINDLYLSSLKVKTSKSNVIREFLNYVFPKNK